MRRAVSAVMAPGTPVSAPMSRTNAPVAPSTANVQMV
jgi:hypothetical protein